MSMPSQAELLLPILKVFADGAEHSNEEIRDLMIVRFDVSATELSQLNSNGKPKFRSNVALALANLQGAPNLKSYAIEKIRERNTLKIYKITEYGKHLLKGNPPELTLKDL